MSKWQWLAIAILLVCAVVGVRAQQQPSAEERIEALTAALGAAKSEAGSCIQGLAALLKENRELKEKLAAANTEKKK